MLTKFRSSWMIQTATRFFYQHIRCATIKKDEIRKNLYLWEDNKHNTLILLPDKRGTYFRPISFKCCPISRTISSSTLFRTAVSVGYSSVSMLPFCFEDEAVSYPSVTAPLREPFACWCIVLLVSSTDTLVFLRGGGTSPPSSESLLEARLAVTFLFKIVWLNQTKKNINKNCYSNYVIPIYIFLSIRNT